MEINTNIVQLEFEKMHQILNDYSIIARNKGQKIDISNLSINMLRTSLIAYFTYRILTDRNKNSARIFCTSLFFLSEEQENKSQGLIHTIILTGIKKSHIPLNRQINTIRQISKYTAENKQKDPLFPLIVGATLALPNISQNLMQKIKDIAKISQNKDLHFLEESIKSLIICQYTKKLNAKLSENRIKEVIPAYKWKWAKKLVYIISDI
ncbi:MAG TPA: hypothetical protein PK957_04105 [Candidatus Dojkabacteria bacterium]|nr:hypothetical protein [Candidatus Dojkabacteria bacterium]HQF36028.1 hypothetical protein [Candidatus Dojkabacteria bacterium]